ncbi:MAG TPA: alpha/beta fold hydrolase [Mycobacteriales bacterium]|nr:alpha/beta fold hydrolase [Mycobacteriales bacterium]
MRVRSRFTALGAIALAGVIAASASTVPAAASASGPTQIPFLSHGVVSSHNVMSGPLGPRKGKSPFGWVMVIHGGGWQMVGRDVMATEDSTVAFVRHLGWATDNIDYRKGEHSLPDVLAAYDALRRKVGAAERICLLGHSAGGNLALLAAEYRPSVACVVSGAGPTDLVHLAHQPAHPLRNVLGILLSPLWTFENYVLPSFGDAVSVLEQWSPVTEAGRLASRVLLGASTFDPLVPPVQMAELSKAMTAQHAPGSIKTVLLAGTKTPAGAEPNFVHASITDKAMTSWLRDERKLLASVAKTT